MQKNTAGQGLVVFCFTAATNLPLAGDAANLTASVSIDGGAVADLADTSAAELDAVKATGYYLFDLAQAETNGDTLLFTARSATGGVVVIAVPATVFTTPPNFSDLAVDSAGGVTLADAVAHGGTPGSSTATLALKQVQVVNAAGSSVYLESNGDHCLTAMVATGFGNGFFLSGGPDGGSGIYSQAQKDDADGVFLVGGSVSGSGLDIFGGRGAVIQGQALAGLEILTSGAGQHDIALTG